jgi:protein-S-isoprenylcysteine O-methyltransferase Ste14
MWDFLQLQRAHSGAVNILGLLLFVIGFILRQIGRRTLGKYYSYGLRISPEQQLITHGIYTHIRHPISLAASLYSLAIPIIFSSVYGFLVMLLMIPLMLYRLQVEEKMLLEKFGDEYREYMQRTKRLVPYLY